MVRWFGLGFGVKEACRPLNKFERKGIAFNFSGGILMPEMLKPLLKVVINSRIIIMANTAIAMFLAL